MLPTYYRRGHRDLSHSGQRLLPHPSGSLGVVQSGAPTLGGVSLAQILAGTQRAGTDLALHAPRSHPQPLLCQPRRICARACLRRSLRFSAVPNKSWDSWSHFLDRHYVALFIRVCIVSQGPGQFMLYLIDPGYLDPADRAVVDPGADARRLAGHRPPDPPNTGCD